MGVYWPMAINRKFFMNNPVKKHLPHLDGIRGWAILLVLLYHCFSSLKVTVICWVGVDLFFVLSGFLITGILLESKTEKFYFRNFIIRRSLRIFPLYYIFILLFFFLIPWIVPGIFGDISYYQNNIGWFILYLQNWLYSFDGFPKSFMFHHLWSLAIEEQFYLVWPFFVYVFSGKNIIRLSVLLILLANFFRFFAGSFTGLIFPYEYVNTFSRIDALLLGALVAVLFRYYSDFLKRISLPVLIICAIVLTAYVAGVRNLNFWKYQPVYTVIGLFFASLLSVSLTDSRAGKKLVVFFSKRPFVFFGKYSYGLYIYHYPIFLSLMLHILPVLKQKLPQSILAEILIGTISILISLVISLLSFKYAEKPFLKLKDVFTKKQPA